MNPAYYRIFKSSKGSRRRRQQPTRSTVQDSRDLEEGLPSPGAVQMPGNHPSSDNDDIVSEDDSTVAPPPSVVEQDSVIRVPEAQLVDPHETEEAIARAVREAREELTESAVRAELVVLQEETQQGQRLQQKDEVQATGEEESSFHILDFIRKHSAISCAVFSLLLLSAAGAGIGVAFSRNDKPALKTTEPPTVQPSEKPTVRPSKISIQTIPNELPTAYATTPSPLEVDLEFSWTQVGSTLMGVATGDRFGDFHAVALSLNGMILAVGAPLSSGAATAVATRPGRVQVFQRQGGTDQQQTEEWQPMGGALSGVAADDGFGDSVALTANGQILAVGAVEYSRRRPGYVRVFEYDSVNNQWNRRGSKIKGVVADDSFGFAVAFSSDGNTLAVGAPKSRKNETDPGSVRVFTFDSSRNAFFQKGSTLTGIASGNRFGWSVDLSDNGTILVVGAPWSNENGSYSGHVRAFRFNSNSKDWDPLGDAIPGVAQGDYFGGSVALSANGMVLAAGAPYNDDNGSDSGHVRAFGYNLFNDRWIQQGATIFGIAGNDGFGVSLALSADGNQVAAGANLNDDIATDSGHIRVFRYEESGGDSMRQWRQVGFALTGVGNKFDYFGYSVAMSADGTVVAGGANEEFSNFLGPGYVCVYEASPEEVVLDDRTSEPSTLRTGQPTQSATILSSFQQTSAPSEAPEAKCQTELELYTTCFATNVTSQDDRLACISCVNDASSNAPLDSCDAFAGSFCNSLSQCTTCGTCAEVATSYIDCIVSDSLCQIDCDGDSGLPPCTSEETAYQSCLPSLGSFRAENCVDCYNAAVQAADTSTCGLFQSQFCSAFNLCDCGSCDDEMIDFLDCRLEQCSILC